MTRELRSSLLVKAKEEGRLRDDRAIRRCPCAVAALQDSEKEMIITQACHVTGKSRDCIRRDITSGRIPGRKKGGQWYVKAIYLRRYL